MAKQNSLRLQKQRTDETSSRLPAPNARHWTARNKAAVVTAVRTKALSLSDACQRYMLTEEEFQSWAEAIDAHGQTGPRSALGPDRRREVRRAISEPAVAILTAANHASCVITDISDHGARLELAALAVLPSVFELRCEKSGRSWWVGVVWQRALTAGVKFDNPLPPPWTFTAGLGDWLLGNRDTVSMDRLQIGLPKQQPR